MKIAMAMTPARAEDVCDPDYIDSLKDRHTFVWASDQLDQAELVRMTDGADLIVTSWRTPQLPLDIFTDRVNQVAVAHAAGTIKKIMPHELMGKVAVFSAAARLAAAVGEYCLTVTLALLKRLPEFDLSMRSDSWRPDGVRGRDLAEKRVGIVGASSTARAFIALLAPFSLNIEVYDPYLSEAAASALGVRCATLNEVLQADIVSIHLPSTPETAGLIDAECVARIRTDAIVVNSSRPNVVDSEALFRRAVSHEIYLAVDVFDTEPVSLDEKIRDCRRILLTPHIAGETIDAHRGLARLAITDALNYLETGARGASWVDPQRWEISA